MSSSTKSRIFAAVVLVATIGAAVVWIRGGGGPEPADGPDSAGPDLSGLVFPPFVLDVETLAPIWDAERADLPPLDEASVALLDAWHRDNFATGVSARGLFEGDPAPIRQALEQRRREWAALRTAEDFRRLGWHAYASFEEALTGLLRMANTTGTRLDDLLADPLQPDVHAYYEACGDFLLGAMQHGIVGPVGELHVQPELILVMFRYRWMHEGSETFPTETPLPGPELREFLRWRVENAELSPAARLALISRYEREFGFTAYPAAFARAVTHARGGESERALASLREALAEAPDNELVAEAARRAGIFAGAGGR